MEHFNPLHWLKLSKTVELPASILCIVELGCPPQPSVVAAFLHPPTPEHLQQNIQVILSENNWGRETKKVEMSASWNHHLTSLVPVFESIPSMAQAFQGRSPWLPFFVLEPKISLPTMRWKHFNIQRQHGFGLSGGWYGFHMWNLAFSAATKHEKTINVWIVFCYFRLANEKDFDFRPGGITIHKSNRCMCAQTFCDVFFFNPPPS